MAGDYGGLGAKLPAAGQFFGKKTLFKYHWITFRKYVEPIESTRFLTFESQLKKLSCPVLLLLAIYVQNTFKILHFGVKFCKRFGTGKGK